MLPGGQGFHFSWEIPDPFMQLSSQPIMSQQCVHIRKEEIMWSQGLWPWLLLSDGLVWVSETADLLRSSHTTFSWVNSESCEKQNRIQWAAVEWMGTARWWEMWENGQKGYTNSDDHSQQQAVSRKSSRPPRGGWSYNSEDHVICHSRGCSGRSLTSTGQLKTEQLYWSQVGPLVTASL